MLRSGKQACALVARTKVLALTATPGLRSLVEEVTGGPIRGSWWAHEKGGLIFELACALDDDADILSAKVALGKVCFVHRSLWPALYRIVTSRQWRRPIDDPAARALLQRIERAGRLPWQKMMLGKTPTQRKQLAAAKKVLETRAVVHSIQEHTDSGNHASTLQSWQSWATPQLRKAAAALPLNSARQTLVSVGLRMFSASL